MTVVPAAVKVTKVWTSSGVSAESMQREDNTAEASAYRGRQEILSPRRFKGFDFLLYQAARIFAGQHPGRYCVYYVFRDVIRLGVFRGRGNPLAGHEQMIQVRKRFQGDIFAFRQGFTPVVKVRAGNLIVAPGLQNQDWDFQLRSGFHWIVSA